MSTYDDFFQTPPVLKNQFSDDRLLESYLSRFIPKESYQEIKKDLERFGQRVVNDIYEMGLQAEKEEPYLKNFDVWGNKVNEVIVSDGWVNLEKVSAEEGLVAIGYERKYKELSRIYQFAKLYLFTPSSAIFTCPLAMTDGAARLIEVYGKDIPELAEAYSHIVSRDPNTFWTSGQWMTERTGGSDVARALTIAEKSENEFHLFGHKWFTSAVTSHISMTLAKIRKPDGTIEPSSRGLSLFYLKIHNDDGSYNNIEVEALKDKLGTRALPTAQLSLHGSKALLIGEEGNGVKKISTLFNVTRIYNAISAVSYMRRAIAISLDYATKREAFKHKIMDHPLHVRTLANMQVEFEAAFHMTFYEVGLMGKEETNNATSEERSMLRLLTPIVKLYTAKQSINVASEHLESLGGVGYLEDSQFPKLLRDVQVLSIWEGTTNVLSLDMLRAINKEKGFEAFTSIFNEKVKVITNTDFTEEKEKLVSGFASLTQFLHENSKKDAKFIELIARDLAFSIFRLFAGLLLIEHAQWCIENNQYENAVSVAKQWFKKDLIPVLKCEQDTIDFFQKIIN